MSREPKKILAETSDKLKEINECLNDIEKSVNRLKTLGIEFKINSYSLNQ